MAKPYYAHKKDGRVQTIAEHAAGTAEFASSFAGVFGYAALGTLLGKYHDTGKYGDGFQARLDGSGESYEHSSAGMKIFVDCLQYRKTNDEREREINRARQAAAILLAYAVAGHHAGLPDYGSPASTENDATIMGKLRRLQGKPCDWMAYREELGEVPEIPPLDGAIVPDTPKNMPDNGWFAYQFLGRMLFSALVDADYLDTERFMSDGAVRRETGDPFTVLFARFDAYMARFSGKTGKLNENRQRILRACIAAAEGETGLYRLTVPTGGGKTLSSMAFALRHLQKHSLRRIIYVIPYVSIIRQTVREFERIFGKENVLGHYATADFWEKERARQEIPTAEELAAENWDKPIIVTTNVQFFESLYANKTSRCRKIHNIANSVLLFDEAQMLPVPLLKPCIRAVSELTTRYGCTAVLCTATQPALDGLFGENAVLREICPDTAAMYADFRRVRYEWCGKVSDDAMLERLRDTDAALCVLNTKRTTRKYFEAMHSPGEDDGVYHLSTYMTPRHLEKTIEKIKARLQAIREGRIQGRCLVFSTSLIEAGVDIDFPTVYREIAGLDSIIQAGGRCNREGKRAIEDSVVYVFEREKIPRGLEEVCGWVQQELESCPDISDPAVITRYFRRLYGMTNVRERVDRLDKNEILPLIGHRDAAVSGNFIPYREIAARFRYIDKQDQKLILVPNEENRAQCDMLRKGMINRKLLRTLAKDMVSLYTWEYEELRDRGVLTAVNDGIAILEDDSRAPRNYNPDCGIVVHGDAEALIL